MHANIVRQDDPADDNTSIFYIFQRINTGGSPAQPQEIRNAIYQGHLNQVLRNLDENRTWRAIYGAPSNRLKDQELILRFLALHYASERYQSPMKEFLNRFMRANRNLDEANARQYGSTFLRTIGFVMRVAGRRAFRPERTLNAAVFDAVMVGLARRLEEGPVEDTEKAKRTYADLLSNEEFRDVTSTGTSQPHNVHSRLEIATKVFGSLR